MSRLSKIGAAALAAFGWTGGLSAVTANYLIVAGGGGAGRGAGGGAGGMLTGTTTLSLSTSYTVTVGAGGAGGTTGAAWADAANGSNSVFTGLTTAVGGGAGGNGGGPGYNGGSGGGAANNAVYPTYLGGLGTAGQGNNGGYNAFTYAGSGGGGAGAAGGNGTGTTSPGAGGAGLQSSISGTATYYAGGGGGSGYDTSNGAAGGAGGGGAGGNAGTTVPGINGTANLGGGGGGGHQTNNSTNGGSGGSGVVIISYPGVQKFGGGVVTTDGTNTIHTFTTSSTLQPLSQLTAQYLIVAGGGGSGSNYGGGSGAGGLLQGTGLTIDTNSTYLVTVGSGGTGTLYTSNGNNGTNSSFSLVSTTAIGGGAGASYPNSGASGGSGGGAGNWTSSQNAGGTGTAGQGNNGGQGSSSGGSGGGGGAGAAGGNGSGSTPGTGGIGVSSSISGTATYYAGGGGGGGSTGAAGGSGGGGTGGSGTANGGNATANTGGGGGGGGGAATGGNGGSGIVIISYPGSTQQMAGGAVTIVGGNVVHTFTSTGYLAPIKLISKSLRFRKTASAYLSRTPAVASNRKTWTWSGWIKRGAFSNGIFQGFIDGSTLTAFGFGGASNYTLFLQDYSASSGYNLVWETSALFRDPASWYHIVLAYDTTQSSSTNAVKIYVNGVQQSLTFTTYGGAYVQNRDSFVNATNLHTIGRYDSASYLDGYMSEVNFIDGQALAPTSFGSFNSYGVWQPIQYGGSYGTNGFYLPFTNTTSTTTLGYDFSPAQNNWTTNNFSLTAGVNYDSMNDSPTLTSATSANYPTINSIFLGSYGGTMVPYAGNLQTGTVQANADNNVLGTMSMPSTGKYYWEVTITGGAASPAGGNGYYLGVSDNIGQYSFGWQSKSGSPFSTTYTTGDVLGFASNKDAGTIQCFKNGVSVGTTTLDPSYVTFIFYYWGNDGTGAAMAVNFGQQPWVYSPPTGFVALNSYNLPTPTIPNGRTVMDATLYTGNNTARSISNADKGTTGFQPDFVWIKDRTNTASHALFDSVRGPLDLLSTNNTNAAGVAVNTLTGFNSTGFSLGVDTTYQIINYSSSTYVAWQWQAGQGTNVTNTSGSITSTVSANPTAGFSIVTWTGNGAPSVTVGHGLNATPSMIITKQTSTTSNWWSYHVSLGTSKGIRLNTTNAATNVGTPIWNPTTSTFAADSNLGLCDSGTNYVAYCWAPIDGYSQFGSYNGNGDATYSPFIYTGFRPKYVLIKNTVNGITDWTILDSARNTYNVANLELNADLYNAEYVANAIDFLSNGFKIRSTYGNTNGSGQLMIYAAFAENPFKYSNAR